MVSTFSPNIQLEEPARGDDVGTWDTPVNNNMSLVDLVAGGITTISLNNSNVTLSAAQFQCKTITFNSTLTGSVTITFPSTFKKSYEIQHLCSGTSAFTITLATTIAGGQAICCSPGEIVDVLNDGTNLKFKSLGRVGTYWDYAGSSVPNWVSGCTVPPYLNCDGTAFSSATYPVLAQIMGGNLVVDSRGRVRTALNQGTGRISGASGVNGNAVGGQGGGELVTLVTAQLPSHSHGVNDPGHFHPQDGTTFYAGPPVQGLQGGGSGAMNNIVHNTNINLTGISIQNTGSDQAHTNMQPTYVGGLTLIRAG